MPALRLTGFQSLAATLDATPIPFRSAKGRALLIYLAVEQDRPHGRTKVAGLLWPDEVESRARKNLSQTLLEVRKAIGDADAAPPFLQITPRTIAFNPQSQHQLDVTDFVAALQNGDFALAADIYTGPFLDDFYISDSDLFEEWMLTTRERLHQQMLTALSELTARHEAQGQLGAALKSVRRLLALAPWQEEAHCQLMRLLALDGQRSAALAQYDALTQMLMDELGVAPAPETDALYDQILAGAIGPQHHGSGSPAGPAIVPAEPPFQALAQPPHFVGRHAQIERLRTQMSAPGLQIHAIVGMGGVGKTTLTTQIAHAARAAFRDGVLWANPLTSNPLDILASWANAYGYDFNQISDLGSRAAAVRGLLAQRQTLIVIDNVRQVSDIEPLLPNGGDCAVLFTTRDLEVAAALNAQTLLLDELDESEALELLREILGDVRVDNELAAAVEICTLCGDLPLAVEIAAQRLKSRPRMRLTQMAERLGHQQQRLALEISDRAVRSSFEVSWAALDAHLQAVFPLLAVFEGRSFTAAAVAGLAELDSYDAEDALYALEALSLVRTEGEARYWQHLLVSDFGREKLGDTASVYGRFADYFYAFAEKNATDFGQLDAEWENILAAMQAAHSQARWAAVCDFAQVLAPPWFTRARFTDARRGLAWAVDAATQSGDAEAAAANRLRWGEACLEQNAYAEAGRHLAQSLAYYDAQGDTLGAAHARDHLARIAIEVNDYARAEALLATNLAAYTAAADRAGVASVHFQQARIAYARADWDAAQEFCEMALTMQTEMGDELGQIRSARLLAQIQLVSEDYTQASDYCRQAQALAEQQQDTSELAITLYTLTGILLKQRQYTTAEACAERSRTLLRRIGDQRTEGLLLSHMADIQYHLGHGPAALQFCRQSVAIARALDDKIALAYALLRLERLCATENLPAEQSQTLQEVKSLAVELDNAFLKKYVQDRYCQ